MAQKFLMSVTVMFFMSMAIGFLIHAVILGQDYAQLPGLYRSQQEQTKYFPYMLLAHVLIAVAFVWIYLKGKEDKPFLVQGIRYAVAIAFLAAVPTYLIYFAVQPLPGSLVFKQIVLDSFGLVLMAIVVAWLNK